MNQIDPRTGKADCRHILRAARKSLTARQQRQAANDLLLHLSALPDLSQFNNIAAYWAADGELSCRAVMQHLQQQGTDILLPLIQDDKSLRFGLYENEEQLSKTATAFPNRAWMTVQNAYRIVF